MTQKSISIVIPVLNEAAIIQQTLSRFANNLNVEVIVVDGGSQDATVAIAKEMKVNVLTAECSHRKALRPVKAFEEVAYSEETLGAFTPRTDLPWQDKEPVTTTRSNRARQMNYGAAMATGDILLFLHADTQLPPNYQSSILDIINHSSAIAGAFQLSIDGKGISLRLVEKLVNWRSRFLSLPYGDQALFISRKMFLELGGFADLAIMEDFEFVRRIKAYGKIAIAPDAVITSSRRWQQLGVWQTTAINQSIILGYYLGISPTKLSEFYRSFGKRKKNKKSSRKNFPRQ